MDSVLYFAYIKLDNGKLSNCTSVVSKNKHNIEFFNKWLAEVAGLNGGGVIANCKIIKE